MKNFRIVIAIITTLVLVNGLWGCTSIQTTRVTPTTVPHAEATPLIITLTSSPEVTATQTTTSVELTGPSSETGISRDQDSQLTPSHPTQVTAQVITDTIVLTWLGTGDDRIVHYQVFRRVDSDEDWQFITNVESTEDNRGWYEFRDTFVTLGIAYIYGIMAVDTYGNESSISESTIIP